MGKMEEKRQDEPVQGKGTISYEAAESLGLFLQLRELLRILHPALHFNSCHDLWASGSAHARVA